MAAGPGARLAGRRLNGVVMRVMDKPAAAAFVRDHAPLFDSHADPFAKSAWYAHFIDQVVEPDWQVMAPEADDGSATMLLYRTPRAPHHWHVLANYYASLVPAVNGAPRAAALVRDLSRHRPACDVLTLAPLSAEDPATGALAAALKDAGWYVRRYLAFGNWYLPGLRWGAYLASRDSQLRHTLQRKGRAFPGQLSLVRDVGEVEAAMDAYEQVYARSWKRPEPYPHFVRAWARRCAAQGWLRLGLAHLDGQPIAAHFWMVVDGKAHIFKLAYDEAHAKFSAGSLLTAMLMEHVLDTDRVEEVDYLSGDDAYKAKWMTQRRERIGLLACNTRTPRGLARAAFEAAAHARLRLRALAHKPPR